MHQSRQPIGQRISSTGCKNNTDSSADLTPATVRHHAKVIIRLDYPCPPRVEPALFQRPSQAPLADSALWSANISNHSNAGGPWLGWNLYDPRTSKVLDALKDHSRIIRPFGD